METRSVLINLHVMASLYWWVEEFTAADSLRNDCAVLRVCVCVFSFMVNTREISALCFNTSRNWGKTLNYNITWLCVTRTELLFLYKHINMQNKLIYNNLQPFPKGNNNTTTTTTINNNDETDILNQKVSFFLTILQNANVFRICKYPVITKKTNKQTNKNRSSL